MLSDFKFENVFLINDDFRRDGRFRDDSLEPTRSEHSRRSREEEEEDSGQN